MDDKTLKKLGDLIAVKIKEGNRLFSVRLENIEHHIKMIYARLETIDEKQDAALVDIHDLQEGVKGLQDEVAANTQINKRRIDEIAEHVGIPTTS